MVSLNTMFPRRQRKGVEQLDDQSCTLHGDGYKGHPYKAYIRHSTVGAHAPTVARAPTNSDASVYKAEHRIRLVVQEARLAPT